MALFGWDDEHYKNSTKSGSLQPLGEAPQPQETTTRPVPSTTLIDSCDNMTPYIRQRIVDIHNEYRSQLAKGQVRSGKPGKANLYTATNIYKMRYDLTLEEEAQAYVDSCPRGGSALSTRPQSGENIEVNPSQTISCLVAVENV
ncbi:hypothetical protein ANCCAN_00804, partial [Ancylostoma caninum]